MVQSVISPIATEVDNPEPEANAYFGSAVCWIGDVNKDGFRDFAVGASGVGKVYLLSGVDYSVICVLTDPDSLGSEGLFGYCVCGVGDLNGDGVEDVAVGAPYVPYYLPLPSIGLPDFSTGDPSWGRAFVFSGATGSMILRFHPTGEYLKFGTAFASLGDADGDGIVDIAVGAPCLAQGYGKVYVFSGRDGHQMWVQSELEFTGMQQIGSFGLFLSSIDDLNGDGIGELLVAAPFYDCDLDPHSSIIAGRSYILDSFDGSVLRIHDDPSPKDNDLFGSGLTTIGDFDGDGVNDYVCAASGSGIVYFYSGAIGNPIGTLKIPTNNMIEASRSGPLFGYQIAVDNDLNGDGYPEFWVAAPGEGMVYLLDGYNNVLAEAKDPNFDVNDGDNAFGMRIALTKAPYGVDESKLLVGKKAQTVSTFGGAGAVFLENISANVLFVVPSYNPEINLHLWPFQSSSPVPSEPEIK
jgi:hypothetical protein